MLGVTAALLVLFIFSIVMLSRAIKARQKQKEAVLCDPAAGEKVSMPFE